MGDWLVAHAIGVFLPNVGFVRNWEEERIRKEMKKNKE
nr:2TM domain-containing protein [Chryseobacterium oranimense]